MDKENKVYRNLQQHIDKCMPIGFPTTKSGSDIKILKQLFSPEEAEIAMKLGPMPEPLDEIATKFKDTGMNVEELENKLDAMAMKAVIMGREPKAEEKGGKQYSLIPWAVGIYEFQVDRLSRELAESAKEYMDEAFYKEWFKPGAPPQMRTVPVAKSIGVQHNVGTYDDVRSLIDNAKGPFSVHNCVCRQNMELLGQPCKLTDDERTCNTFGETAELFLKVGLGREVTKDEMLKALDKYEEKGFVLQPQNSQTPSYICACCGCCCGVLQMMKKFPKPAELYTSNYCAKVDAQLCNGCETCLERCQMEALAVEDEVAEVNLDRCIGCGLCVSTCETGAIQLSRKEKEIVPPKDREELYQTIMVKKLGG